MRDWKRVLDSLSLPAFVLGSDARVMISNPAFDAEVNCPGGTKVRTTENIHGKRISPDERVFFGAEARDVFLIENTGSEMLFVLGKWKTVQNDRISWSEGEKELLLLLSDKYGNISYQTDGFSNFLMGMRRAIDSIENLYPFFATDETDLQRFRKVLLDGERYQATITNGPLKGCEAVFATIVEEKFENSGGERFIACRIDRKEWHESGFGEMLKIHNAFDEISPFAFMVVTGDNVIFANSQAKELFGLPKNQAVGHIEHDVPIPSRLKEALKNELESMEDISSSQIEYKERLGKTMHLRVVSKTLEFFGKPSKLLVIHDITVLNQIKQRLARFENLERLVEILGREASGKENLNRYLEAVLKSICKHFGLVSGTIYFEELGDFVQKKVYGEPNGPISEIHRFAIRKVFENGKPQVVGSTLLAKDEVYYLLPISGPEGTTGVFSFRSHVLDENIINQFSAIMPIVASGVELSRIKEREVQYLEELERLSSFRSDILEAVNHEMKTPLTSILGYAELILSGTIKGNEQITNAANSVYAAGKQLETLLRELSKLSYGTIVVPEMNIAETNVKDVLRTVSNLMLPIFEAAILSFRANIPENLPPVKADPTKLKEILLNMLTNAAKYTESGGEITLSASLIGGSFTRIEVRDTGIGISNEKKRFIFKKYYRLANEKTGKGLGLYLSKIYAEAMGGKIYFESEGRGKGTTFYLVLPSINSNPR
ncbi:MAG: PAS domain-containing sensor histidine kinase [Caldisericales bacterium]|nr:PAS domain-containing sensor histidine kinase [Caldisericales bacterium]